jgi:hypothetical protein
MKLIRRTKLRFFIDFQKNNWNQTSEVLETSEVFQPIIYMNVYSLGIFFTKRDMEFIFLGTSSGTPTKTRNVSGVAVKMANSKFLVPMRRRVNKI